MELRLVSCVLVTWNSSAYLPRCLEGIRNQSWARTELIVVDNASTDGSADACAAAEAQVIRNDANRGFAAAVNQAIDVARGEFILLVNPDCFLHSDYIGRLVAAFDDAGPHFGAATGMLLRAQGPQIEPTGEIDSMGIRMTRSGRHFDLGQGMSLEGRGPRAEGREDRAEGRGLRAESMNSDCRRSSSVVDPRTPTSRPTNHEDPPTPGPRPSALGPQVTALGPRPLALEDRFEVFGVSGAAAMYRAAFLRDVAIDGQVFDEDFFAYREDADVAWRGQLFGWRALCEPRAVADHVRHVTPEVRRDLSATINMHSVKNRFLLRLKNEGWHLAVRNAPFELTRDLIVIAAAVTVEQSSLPAFSWIWTNRARVLARRRAIQARRKVSDRALARWFE